MTGCKKDGKMMMDRRGMMKKKEREREVEYEGE